MIQFLKRLMKAFKTLNHRLITNMIASRLLTLTPSRIQTVHKCNTRKMSICRAKKDNCKEPPNPYELFDSTVKMMSTPATAPILEEMKKTNKALEKIVDILDEIKKSKQDECTIVEPNDVY